MIMVGDPILVTTERCELQTAMITGMSQAGKKEKRIPINVYGSSRRKLLVCMEWRIQFKSDGSKVFLICPELRVNDEFMYSFDRQVIFDMGVGMNVGSQQEGATVSR